QRRRGRQRVLPARRAAGSGAGDAVSRRRGSPRRGGPARWTIWLAAFAPALVARVLVGLGFVNFEQLIGLVVACMALVLLTRRPARSLAVLLTLLPFQLVLTSLLFRFGVTAGVTRMAALWKELVVLAIVVAAWRRTRERPGRFDPLDRVATAFVLLGTA